MSIDALGFCLHVSRAHASMTLKLDEDLGAFHGLNYGDFTLLHLLVQSKDGRMAMADLAHMLGLSMSGLIRKMITLEKIGLAERVAAPGEDGRRFAAIRSGGRQLAQEARITVEAICAKALRPLDPKRLPEIDAALLALCGQDASHT